MTEYGRKVLHRAIDAFNAHDPDGFVACFHPDLVFVPLLTPPAAEPYVGREGMRRYMADATSWSPTGRVELGPIRDFVDVVIADARLVVSSGDAAVSVDVVYVVRLEDGLIRDLVTLADGADARRELGVADRENLTDELLLELPADPGSVPAVRRAARAFAEAAGCRELPGIELAVTEAATNVVLHAYLDDGAPGPLVLGGRREDSAIVLSVQDVGRGLRPRIGSPGLGMGLGLMQHHAAEVAFVGPPQRERGTEVRLRFPL